MPGHCFSLNCRKYLKTPTDYSEGFSTTLRVFQETIMATLIFCWIKSLEQVPGEWYWVLVCISCIFEFKGRKSTKVFWILSTLFHQKWRLSCFRNRKLTSWLKRRSLQVGKKITLTFLVKYHGLCVKKFYWFSGDEEAKQWQLDNKIKVMGSLEWMHDLWIFFCLTEPWLNISQ